MTYTIKFTSQFKKDVKKANYLNPKTSRYAKKEKTVIVTRKKIPPNWWYFLHGKYYIISAYCGKASGSMFSKVIIKYHSKLNV